MSWFSRAVEQLRQVEVPVRARRAIEVIVKRHVEQAHRRHVVYIRDQLVHARRPVFPHREELAPGVVAHLGKPALVELAAHVLERVEAEPVEPRRVQVPLAPAHELVVHGLVRKVHVAAHQVVVVAVVVVVHLVVPALAVKQVDSAAARGVVPVHAVKAAPVPRERGVPPAPARKAEPGPRTNLVRARDHAVAVIRGNLACDDVLRRVRAHALVQHHVAQRLHARGLQRPDARKILVLRSVLGGDGALLVKLAQVVRVVHAVAHVEPAGLALVRGRQPHRRDSLVRKALCALRKAPPVRTVSRKVPAEPLQHGSVVHQLRLRRPHTQMRRAQPLPPASRHPGRSPKNRRTRSANATPPRKPQLGCL